MAGYEIILEHQVYGSVMLNREEEKLLNRRVAELRRQFPESKINLNNFLDMALRVGVDMELASIRKRLEADEHAEHG